MNKKNVLKMQNKTIEYLQNQSFLTIPHVFIWANANVEILGQIFFEAIFASLRFQLIWDSCVRPKYAVANSTRNISISKKYLICVQPRLQYAQ